MTLALVAEAARRSSPVWITADGAQRARAAWQVWHDGALCLVLGGDEQPLDLPPSGTQVTVAIRSRDTGGLLVTARARVADVGPADPRWSSTVTALAAARLNAPDGERAPQRWATGSRVVRLEPYEVITGSSDAARPARAGS